MLNRIAKELGMLIVIFILVFMVLTLASCDAGNKQWWGKETRNNTFNKAIVDYGNGTLEIYDINQWTDFENSDMVQFIDIYGNVYLTHSSKVVLKYEK